MKWPFVRRSKYESLQDENEFRTEALRIKSEYIINLSEEINRLNQELANELNSHRETRETKNKVIESNLNQIRGLEGFFEREFNLHKETKDALKIAQEETRQHRMTIDFADEKEEKIKQYLIKVINYI